MTTSSVLRAPHGVLARYEARRGRVDTANPILLLHAWPGEGHAQVTAQLQRVCIAVSGGGQRLAGQDLLAAVVRRRAAAVADRPGATRRLLIRPMWRLVIGHGQDTVLETGLTLSPTYGVPIIPGSALKGLAASAAGAAGWPDLPRVFGSPRAGSTADIGHGTVRFYDAFPAEPPRLELDVLTPHAVPYYNEGNRSSGPDPVITTPPAEYHNPNPVRFLTVANTPFEALLAGLDPVDLDRVVEVLRAALDERGIGGKTAAGYGYCTLKDVDAGPGYP